MKKLKTYHESFSFLYCYRPHPKDGEDTVFTGISLSVDEGGVSQSQVLFLVSGERSFLGGYPSPRFFHWSLVPGPFLGVPLSQIGVLQSHPGVPQSQIDRNLVDILTIYYFIKHIVKKRKVLLHGRKRHTTYSIASTRHSVSKKGTPAPAWGYTYFKKLNDFTEVPNVGLESYYKLVVDLNTTCVNNVHTYV